MEKMKDHLGEVFDVGDETVDYSGTKRTVFYVLEERALFSNGNDPLIKHATWWNSYDIGNHSIRIIKKRFLGKDQNKEDVHLRDRIKPDGHIEGFAVDYRKGRFIVEYNEPECENTVELHAATRITLVKPKFPKEEKPNIQIFQNDKLVYDNKEPLSVETARGMKIIK